VHFSLSEDEDVVSFEEEDDDSCFDVASNHG
jgi:hypothetical protein